ncbi:MAG: ThuA domain-containing protein [Cyclobacteriaceae bacterium]|nr:ThuA domain-containing protein [Cyclobacteriaceae bacterium]
MKLIIPILLICLFFFKSNGQKIGNVNWKEVRVLIYTKNGKGYVHENIPAAVSCIQKLGQQYGFKTEVSENPNAFTEENLKQYTLLIFTSTNNDVFDSDEQRLAFRHFIEAGGGFVGIHSVVGTERNWDWFKMMLGGTFSWHPKFQKYKLQVIDKGHPSTSGLPTVWEKEDECYFQKEMYPGIKTILAHDINSLKEDDQEKIKLHAGPYSKLYPAAWYQKFDGGYIWITALGHDKKDYEDPTYVNHIFQGIKFVASQLASKEYSKAYAQNRDEVIKN